MTDHHLSVVCCYRLGGTVACACNRRLPDDTRRWARGDDQHDGWWPVQLLQLARLQSAERARQRLNGESFHDGDCRLQRWEDVDMSHSLFGERIKWSCPRTTERSSRDGSVIGRPAVRRPATATVGCVCESLGRRRRWTKETLQRMCTRVEEDGSENGGRWVFMHILHNLYIFLAKYMDRWRIWG